MGCIEISPDVVKTSVFHVVLVFHIRLMFLNHAGSVFILLIANTQSVLGTAGFVPRL